MDVSVILRTRDEAQGLRRLLPMLAAQKGPEFEMIAVDSGSVDESRKLLREAGARVVDLAPAEFSYGLALNLGCREAAGKFLVFLSAHAVPRSDMWLGELTAPLESDGSLAGVSGSENGRVPGLPGLQAPLLLDREAYLRSPYAGLCNSNAAVRHVLWERFPFNERLTGAEDKEWTLRVLSAGYRVMLLPGADVEHRHAEGLRQAYCRGFREHLAFREFGAPIGAYGLHRFLLEAVAAPVRSLGGELLEWPCYVARCWGKYRALSGAVPPSGLYNR